MLTIGVLSWLQLHRHCCHGHICCNCVTIVYGCNFIDTEHMDICVAIEVWYCCNCVARVLQFIMNLYAIVLTLLALSYMLQLFCNCTEQSL